MENKFGKWQIKFQQDHKEAKFVTLLNLGYNVMG